MPILENIFFAGDLCLYNPNGYYYLKQSGCISDPTIDDKQDFMDVLVRYFHCLRNDKISID